MKRILPNLKSWRNLRNMVRIDIELYKRCSRRKEDDKALFHALRADAVLSDMAQLFPILTSMFVYQHADIIGEVERLVSNYSKESA